MRSNLGGIIGDVPDNQRITLDRTDEAILQALQTNGRMSTADLARTVSLSPRWVTRSRLSSGWPPGRIATLGKITTNVVYSSPLTGRRLLPA
ncbi:AsnC family transcriptional regulator [Mycolicibacterium pyrenivorans]|uniref:AsnC family transcriptional regulator n=1 Tax=Mycolicibacterium pyrenivorans TaxID=187102 RepID=UPI0023AB1A7D|nr:AsnC family transcriptional regulator [Mycolicibacterium pyrenivorans]MCV7153410.1 AsnC family transcriptional regulator [Mycolicibacterium pyrenivorans]